MVETHAEKINNYLKRNLDKGYTAESLKWSLIQQGYSRTDVQRALDRVLRDRSQRESMREKPVIKTEIYTNESMPAVSKVEETPWYASGTFWFIVVLLIVAGAVWTKRRGIW